MLICWPAILIRDSRIFPKHVLPQWLDDNGIEYRIEYRDTYSVVKEKVPEGATYCALCSRLRRGNLYRIAREEDCDALVLGHHREDILETFFLNLFHGGKLAAMPPKLLNDVGDLLVLRPLSYCAEDDLARFADAMNFPIIPCDLCGVAGWIATQCDETDDHRYRKPHAGPAKMQ